MSSTQILGLLHGLLAKHERTPKHLEQSLQCLVLYLDRDINAKIRFRKRITTVLSKKFSTCVHQVSFQALGGADTRRQGALVVVDGQQTSEQDERKQSGNYFYTSKGKLTTWRLVLLACNMILSVFDLWHENQSFTVQHTDASSTHRISINPNKLRALMPVADYKQWGFDKTLEDPTFLRAVETSVYSSEFFIDRGNRVLLDSASDQWDTLSLLRLILDQQVVVTNLQLGGSIQNTQDASTYKDLLALYSVRNSTAVSALAWDVTKKPGEWKVVRDKYRKRAVGALGRALETVKMYFVVEHIAPQIAACAQEVTNLKQWVSTSSNTLNWKWVLIEKQDNAEDMQALVSFIFNNIELLANKTNLSNFEKSILDMARLFRNVYESLAQESRTMSKDMDAPTLWSQNDIKLKPDPISMLDLHSENFTKSLHYSPLGKRHSVFVYEMLSLRDQELSIQNDYCTNTKANVEMHVIFELMLHSLSFPCTNHTKFSLKPMFLGYTRSNTQQTYGWRMSTMPFMPHYLSFAQREHTLHQLIPLVLPRVWKAVSYADVEEKIKAPGSEALSIADFKDTLTSNTYELTDAARKRLQKLSYFNGTYLHFTNDTTQRYLVPVLQEHVHFDESSIFYALLSEYYPHISFNVLQDVFVNKWHVISKFCAQLSEYFKLYYKIMTEKMTCKLNLVTGISLLGSLLVFDSPAAMLCLFLSKVTNVYDDIFRKSSPFFRLFPYVACLGMVYSYLFDTIADVASTRKLLSELYDGFESLKFIHETVNFCCLALEIRQFTIQNRASFRMLNILDDYIQNQMDKHKQQKVKELLENKVITEDCISTLKTCAHDLEARFDVKSANVNIKRNHAKRVVGYCRVLSLRMMMMLVQHQSHGDAPYTQNGTLKLLKACLKKMNVVYDEYAAFGQDEMLYNFKTQANSTVNFCVEYFENTHNEADYKNLRNSVASLWQNVSQAFGSTVDEEENNWHKMLKYISVVMIFFYCRTRSLLLFFEFFGNPEIDTQIQRLLYKSYKAQAFLQYDGTWYRMFTRISAMVDFVYFAHLLSYCSSGSNTSFSTPAIRECKDAKHVHPASDKYEHNFICFLQQQLQSAQTARPLIADIQNRGDSGIAHSGAHTLQTMQTLRDELLHIFKNNKPSVEMNACIQKLCLSMGCTTEKLSTPCIVLQRIQRYQNTDNWTKYWSLRMMQAYLIKQTHNHGCSTDSDLQTLHEILKKTTTETPDKSLVAEMLDLCDSLKKNSPVQAHTTLGAMRLTIVNLGDQSQS